MRPLQWIPILLSVALLAACSSGGSSPTTTSTSASGPRLVAVVLGDSFSSGEGAPPYDLTPKSCKHSAQGWARRLQRDARGIASLDLRACSGATATELLAASAEPGRPAQIPSTPIPSVTLVTLTIGGNDIGFGTIVATCFVVSCAGVPRSTSFLDRIHALTTTLDTRLYPALERAYPNARIAHIGYPRLTPAVGHPVRGCAWLTADEQPATAQIVAELDKAIVAAGAGHPRVTYLDTTDALAGHELCSGSSWVNPVTIGGASQAHPTADGQRALERAIARALHLTL